MEVLRALVVEDNPDHAELMRACLERENIVSDVVGSGGECLERAGEGYDVILLDYSLPDIDGLEVLKELRGVDLPVVMITGHGDEQVAVEAMKGGAYDYVVKSGMYFLVVPEVARRAVEAHRTSKRLKEELIQAQRREAIVQTAIAVNHEINNPLGVILGNAELLLSQLKDSDEGVVRKLRIIEEQCLKIKEITRRLANLTDPVLTEYLKGREKMLDIHGSK
ncbi:MAG TPA: response regulator [Candidatus Latescibacteria bacterium]|nr:response regulator [Candidatus Latescibacterota bacterium]